jgi:hypothetical protein
MATPPQRAARPAPPGVTAVPVEECSLDPSVTGSAAGSGSRPAGFGEQAQPSDVHQEVVDAGHASTESLPERRRLGSRRPVVEAHPGVFGRSAMNHHVPRRRRIESRAADPGDFTGASGVASRTPSTPQ